MGEPHLKLSQFLGNTSGNIQEEMSDIPRKRK